MRTFLRDSFTLRLVGGFVLGAIGVVLPISPDSSG